jgi:hypothetical protein
MSQSRKLSLIETAVNVIIGYVVAVSIQVVVINATFGASLWLWLVFMACQLMDPMPLGDFSCW